MKSPLQSNVRMHPPSLQSRIALFPSSQRFPERSRAAGAASCAGASPRLSCRKCSKGQSLRGGREQDPAGPVPKGFPQAAGAPAAHAWAEEGPELTVIFIAVFITS